MDENLALELNGGNDEDAALRRAIELSMGSGSGSSRSRPTPPGTSATPIDLTFSSSDEERTEKPTTAGSSSSMLGLDRKKMEEERLARLKKRKALGFEDVGAQPLQQKMRQAGGPVGGIVPPHLSQAIAEYRATQASPDKELAKSHESASAPKTASLPFPKGVVKKTWAFGQSRTSDDIKIEEVLQKNELELAVLSSFQWDDEWLMSKLNLRKTKAILIAFASDEAQKEEMRSNVPGSVIRFCFPPMQGVNCMHSKLQLLKFEKYLRVVVPSGNLVPYDWGETGLMENVVFLIDLPRIEDIARQINNQLTEFGEDLCYFLKAQGMDENLIKSLHNYDFSETARYGFVHTIGGSHTGDSWKRTGYCGLGRTVHSLGLGADAPVEIDFLCSSVGSVNNDLLAALYNACQGDSGMREYEVRTNRPKKSKDVASSEGHATSFKSRFRVYFPSHDTVLQSRGGKDAAGTITFQLRWWNTPTFPRDILRDSKNVRHGLLTHSKMIFVRRLGWEPNTSPGWAYVGSANMSESAWGRLVKDRATGKAKLTCRNWESGVLIPAAIPRSSPDDQAATQTKSEGPHMLDIFRGEIPIPLELPGSPYGSESSKIPWFYQDG